MGHSVTGNFVGGDVGEVVGRFVGVFVGDLMVANVSEQKS